MATATETPVLNDPFEMTATASGGDFPVCPAGNFPGVLIGIIDAGTHPETFKDKKTGQEVEKDVRKVVLLWELPGEIQPDGSPFVLGLEFTNSFGESANLRKMVEGWRGRKFEEGEKFSLTTLMTKPCIVNVIHKKTSKGKDVANIDGIKPPIKGMPAPTPQHEPILYAIASGNEPPDYEWLPRIFGEKIADKVRDSREWKAARRATSPNGQAGGDDEDIPF